MPTDLDEATKRRLVYVKKLYMHGHEHIPYGTEFDRMIAIHHFDNAVELLLRCVATNYNISFRSLHVAFPNLWKSVDEKCSLPKKTEMFQLHDFRSNVQHWGISPFSSEVVNRFDVYVSDFIREVLEQVFRLDFEELFMSSLVEDKTLRKILTTAEKAFEEEDYVKAIRWADAAFNRAQSLQSEEFGGFRSVQRGPLEEIEDKVSVLALGIDYRDYKKYKKCAPLAIWDESKEDVWYSEPFFKTADAEGFKEIFSRENALFSLNFVLDCILR